MALALVVAVLSVIVVGLLRRFSEALERVEQRLTAAASIPETGLQRGQRVPSFTVRTAADVLVQLPMDGPLLSVLVLLEPGCVPCDSLAAELDQGGWLVGDVPLFVVLPDGPASRAMAPNTSGAHIVYQAERAASKAFEVNVSPVAFAVDSAGVIVDNIVPDGTGALLELAAHPTTHRSHSSAKARSSTSIL